MHGVEVDVVHGVHDVLVFRRGRPEFGGFAVAAEREVGSGYITVSTALFDSERIDAYCDFLSSRYLKPGLSMERGW